MFPCQSLQTDYHSSLSVLSRALVNQYFFRSAVFPSHPTPVDANLWLPTLQSQTPGTLS
jgi:hypothetical protein